MIDYIWELVQNKGVQGILIAGLIWAIREIRLLRRGADDQAKYTGRCMGEIIKMRQRRDEDVRRWNELYDSIEEIRKKVG